MTLCQIYEQFTPGSQGFCISVETHCGFELSREEIAAIAEKAETAHEFKRLWESG